MTTLSYCRGDIFASTAQVIVNPVNCKGHMGKGLRWHLNNDIQQCL